MQIQAVKKYLPLIIGGICGLIAVVLINNYVKQQTEEAKKIVAQSQKNLITVVVAKQDIPAGATIKESMVGEATLNKNMVQPRSAVSIDRVVGKISIAPIAKGEQVLLNKVTASEEVSTLAMKVPSGKRAVTVSVDNISSVGGMLRPGDHVDIVGMVPIPVMNAEGKQVNQLGTMPLFQDVLVLAVGQEFMSVSSVKKEEKSTAASPVITFALSPQDANLIVFVQEQGKIRLVLRSPGDTQTQQVAPASWDTLFRAVMPQASQQEKMAAPPKPKKTVEIFRGLNKEIKTIE